MEYLTIVIALLTFLIAFYQFKNARYQIRIDLFEKRRKVYLDVGGIIARCVTKVNTKEDPFGFQLASEIGRLKRESTFLFKVKLKTEIDLIFENALRLSEIDRRLNPSSGDSEPIGETRNQLAEEKRHLMSFLDKALQNLEELFFDQMSINK